MDQPKIGKFLRTLRLERGLTQTQLAELLGVTNRSVSRWETGVNLPDLDLVLELTAYYQITLEKFLDGQRRSDPAAQQPSTETLLRVADYQRQDQARLSRRICGLFLLAIGAFVLYGVLDVLGLGRSGVGEAVSSMALGIVFGMLLLGALLTSRRMARIRVWKQRLLHRAPE